MPLRATATPPLPAPGCPPPIPSACVSAGQARPALRAGCATGPATRAARTRCRVPPRSRGEPDFREPPPRNSPPPRHSHSRRTSRLPSMTLKTLVFHWLNPVASPRIRLVLGGVLSCARLPRHTPCMCAYIRVCCHTSARGNNDGISQRPPRLAAKPLRHRTGIVCRPRSMTGILAALRDGKFTCYGPVSHYLARVADSVREVSPLRRAHD